LTNTGTEKLSYETIFKKLKSINDTEYCIDQLYLSNLQSGLYIPFKELNSIKQRVLFILNGSKEIIAPVAVPTLKSTNSNNSKASLSVLISSQHDLYLCNETLATICFQLPECLKDKSREFTDLLTKTREIIPWFPSVLIGENYHAAIEIIQQVQPTRIVTNNTGIAYEAFKRGIPWIAGPFLNLVNSYSLLCLKENFNCCGAYISNEISKAQIRNIRKPDDFELYYSICHPIELMTCRQCLFHQVTGCKKEKIDDACILQCEKSATITNLKNDTFFIEKSRGNHHKIYNRINYLNTDIVTDFPQLFTGFHINLSDIKTETKIEEDKLKIINNFENLINGIPHSKEEVELLIYPSTNTQYEKGI
jgi:putative protease